MHPADPKGLLDPKRVSLWLMAAAMVLVVALKEDRVGWPHFHLLGWPLIAASLLVSLRQSDRTWSKTLALLAYTIAVLFFTRVDAWDELAWINFTLCLLMRHFSFWEANLAQAVFFTSFLYDMSFFHVGPLVIFPFALIQGYTYERTGSLLYIMILHLLIDTALFYMIANRWIPGWGW